jgi:hypothetical protein
MKIIVTGDSDEEMVYAALDVLHAITPVTMVIECGGPHAELWARFWAEDNGVKFKTVREETPIRTASKAFSYNPGYVLAFPWPAMPIIDKATRKGVQIGYAYITVSEALDGAGVSDAPGKQSPAQLAGSSHLDALDQIGGDGEDEVELRDHLYRSARGADPELADCSVEP